MTDTKCKFCDGIFLTNEDMVQHVNQYHLDKVSQSWKKCDKCESVFLPTQKELERHKRLHHPGKRLQKILATVKCQYCPNMFRKHDACYKHARLKHPDIVENFWQSCDVCPKKFPNEQCIENHKNVVHGAGRQMTESQRQLRQKDCDWCTFKFADKRKFYKHANLAHFDIISVLWPECDKCNVFFPTEEVLSSHKATSTCNERDLSKSTQCEFCPKQFSRPYIYFKHASERHLSSVADIWAKCIQCPSYFPTENSLEIHVLSKHGRNKNVNAGKGVLCSYCPLSLNCPNSYYKHANRKHRDYVRREWLSCNDCDMTYPTIEILNYHHASAHRRVSNKLKPPVDRVDCVYCPDTFCRIRAYIVHVNSRHKEKAQLDWFPCNECDMHYPTEKNLVAHQTTAHSKVNPEDRKPKRPIRPCPFCPRIVKNSDIYLKHVNRDHADVVHTKWIACPLCPGLHYPNRLAMTSHFSHKHKQLKMPKELGQDTEEVSNVVKVKKEKKEKSSKKNVSEDNGNKENEQEIKQEDEAEEENPSLQTEFQITQCNFCEENFIEEDQFIRHCNDHHPKQIARSWRHRCTHCRMLFSSSDLLQSHIDIEHYSFPCQYCTEEFGTIDDYAKHGSYEHSDNVQLNWFECDMCGFYYPSAKNIQDHTRVCRIIKVEMKEIDSEMQEIRNVEELMSFEQTDVLDSHQDVLDSHQEEEKFSGDEKGVDDETYNFDLYDEDSDATSQNDASVDDDVKQDVFVPKPLCKICDRPYANLHTLNRHFRTVHSRSEEFVCVLCHHGYENEVDYEYHDCEAFPVKLKDDEEIMTDSVKFECSTCEKKFTDLLLFRRHVANLHNPARLAALQLIKLNDEQGSAIPIKPADDKDESLFEFSCNICEKRFEKNRNLTRHKYRVHKVFNEVQCEMCHKSFRNAFRLKHHRLKCESLSKRATKPERNLPCDVCGKLFAHRTKLVKHKRIMHSDGPLLQCNLCPKKFYVAGYLTRHMVMYHMNGEANPTQSEDGANKDLSFPDESKPSVYKCEDCDKVFEKKDYLSKHKRHVHKLHQPIPCDICGKVFSQIFNLRAHTKRVHVRPKDIKCEECGKGFMHQCLLLKHVRAIHQNIKLQCEQCPRTFSTIGYLNSHVALVHLKTISFICDLCGAEFSGNMALKRHIGGVHSKDREHECKDCGKMFKDEMLLRRHGRTAHVKMDEEKSFQCSECDKTFSHNHALKRHLKNAHGKEEILNCQFCSLSFTETALLRNHQMDAHPNEKKRNFGCTECSKKFTQAHVLRRHIRNIHCKDRDLRCKICGEEFFEKHALKKHLLAHSRKTESVQTYIIKTDV